MFNITFVAGAIIASLACTTLVSAQSVRDRAIKAAYQGPDARLLKVHGKLFAVKKANVRLGPGTRVVDGQISHIIPFLPNAGGKVSYTMVFRRDGSLIDVSIRGVNSAGVYNAVTKQTSTTALLNGSWRGTARYLIAEIGRAVPKDWVGIPIPIGHPLFPGQTLPTDGDVMDGGEEEAMDGDVAGGEEGNYEDDEDVMDGGQDNYEGDSDAGGEPTNEELEDDGGSLGQQNYFLGVSTSRVVVPSGHATGQYSRDRKQRFGGESYGLRINSLVPGSPAGRSRLERGDIIIAVNQKPMTQLDSLKKAVAASNGQLDLIVRNVRNGQTVAVTVKLEAQIATVKRSMVRQRR